MEQPKADAEVESSPAPEGQTNGPGEPTDPAAAALTDSEVDDSRFLGAEPPVTSMPSLPPTPQPGALQANQVFGKYRVVRDMGAGGMAQVFLAAIDGPEGFQKQCVVKKILPEYARDPNFSQMFVTEARIAAMMSHHNIVHVFEFSKVGDEYFLAMEYVSGAALDRVMRAARRAQVPLGPRVAVEVGIGIAHALAYAHALSTPDGTALNLVHRDISPENILLSRDGAVKLTDFGVVKSDANTNATVAGMVKGKWAYMSPEQVLSKPLDGRSDLFSLGIVLYELAVGRRLFRGDSVATTVNAVLRAEVARPSTLVPDFPLQLERILMTLLNRDPALRVQSAASLATALEKFRATQPWTSGGKHLGSVVNSLFPKDGSQPGAVKPGSGASTAGIAAAANEPDDELPPAAVADEHIHIDVDQPKDELSTPLVLAVGAAAILASALFWYFLV